MIAEEIARLFDPHEATSALPLLHFSVLERGLTTPGHLFDATVRDQLGPAIGPAGPRALLRDWIGRIRSVVVHGVRVRSDGGLIPYGAGTLSGIHAGPDLRIRAAWSPSVAPHVLATLR